MRGPEEVARLLLDVLEDRLPAKLTELEERLDLPAGTVEHPGLYAGEDRPQLELEAWPAVLVVPRTAELRLVEAAAGREVYQVSYPTRVYGFARGQEFAETAAARNRLILAIREVLLTRPSLGDLDARLEVSNYRESYSDVDIEDRDGRSIAGAYAEVSVILEETMASADLHPGPLEPVVTALPPHPALD